MDLLGKKLNFKTEQNCSVGLKNKFNTKQNGSVGLEKLNSKRNKTVLLG
jgi:hypothetical protein